MDEIRGVDAHDVEHRKAVLILWRMVIEAKGGSISSETLTEADLFLDSYRAWTIAKCRNRITRPFVELIVKEGRPTRIGPYNWPFKEE